MARVSLNNAVKVYPGGVKAVDDFCLDIADGEFVVLVGPSGCGKSTTLRMVAGLEELDGGTIRIDDRVVNDVPPKDRDIAMVFQSYALYPHMTVYKNMAFGLKMRKLPRAAIDQRVRDAARILDIEELLDRKPKALSGGQRQRVAVGRAIVRDPTCFLFDEPLSNLDAKLRLETRAEIKRLHRRLKTTTIYVTHDQEEAMTLGDRVVVMNEGRIQQCDTPLEIYRQPANRFVAGFVGTPGMNFLDGTLVKENGTLWFDEGSMKIRVRDEAVDALSDRIGQHLVMGVRPEMFSDQPDGKFSGSGNELRVNVDVVEPLGERVDVYLSTENNPRIVARIDADQLVAANTKQTFFVDLDRIHFFGPGELGENLTCNSNLGSPSFFP